MKKPYLLPLLLSLIVLAGFLDPAPAPALPISPRVAERVPLPLSINEHLFEPCPFLKHPGSCARPWTTETWVRDYDHDTDYFRWVRWHERGHIADYQRLTPSDRAYIRPLLGFGEEYSDHWWPRVSGERVPSERFADIYASCALNIDDRPGATDWTGYGASPTQVSLRRLCGVLAYYQRKYPGGV